MNKPKVYLDMDGVIADFHKKYVEIKGNPEWCDVKFKELVTEHRIFRNLDWMPHGKILFSFLTTARDKGLIDLEILSSCGTWNLKIAPLSAEQKTHWLNERGGKDIKKNFVHSFDCKKRYANQNAFLIDDRVDCVEPFISAGGHGHLHNDNTYNKTIESVLVFIENQGKDYANLLVHQ